MKIKFAKEYQASSVLFRIGDVLDDINNNCHLEILNERYILLILNGLRYDIPRQYINFVKY